MSSMLFAVLLVGGCTPTRHRRVKDADGQTNVLIRCRKETPAKCNKRAGQVCRGEYAVVDELHPDPQSGMELTMTVHCTRIHE